MLHYTSSPHPIVEEKVGEIVMDLYLVVHGKSPLYPLDNERLRELKCCINEVFECNLLRWFAMSHPQTMTYLEWLEESLKNYIDTGLPELLCWDEVRLWYTITEDLRSCKNSIYESIQ